MNHSEQLGNRSENPEENHELNGTEETIKMSEETKKVEQESDNILVLNPKTRTLTIPVEDEEIQNLEDSTQIDGKTFQKKDEFHITVIWFQKAKELKKLFKENPESEVELNTIIQELDWNYSLKPEKYHIIQDTEKSESISKKLKKKLNNPETKEETLKQLESEGKKVDMEKWTITQKIHKESIIQMIDLPAIKEFYDRVYNELWIDLGEVPPAHTTLYTYGDPTWIAINSQQDLEKLQATKIENLDNS